MPLEPPAFDASAPRKDWTAASRKELVAHLVDHHHVFARAQLALLSPLLETVLLAEGDEHPELFQVRRHFRDLVEDLLAHFRMEEGNLFPAILAMEAGGPVPISLGTPEELLLTIQAEHQAVEELFLNIRMLTSDYGCPGGASSALQALYTGFAALEDDLHLHIYLEDHVLFSPILPPAQR
jgi:regulator of cell morphogenesis and NO signaling